MSKDTPMLAKEARKVDFSGGSIYIYICMSRHAVRIYWHLNPVHIVMYLCRNAPSKVKGIIVRGDTVIIGPLVFCFFVRFRADCVRF